MRSVSAVVLILSQIVWVVGEAAAQVPTNGLAFWVDASDLNGDGAANNPANGTTLGNPTGGATWVSKVPIDVAGTPTQVAGYAEDGSGATPGRQPTYLSSGINGQPAVQFNIVAPGGPEGSSNDVLQFRAVGGTVTSPGYRMDMTKPFTAFVVMQYSAPTNGTLFSTANAFSGEPGDLIRQTKDGTIRYFSNGGFGDSAPTFAPGAGIIAVSNAAVANGGSAPLNIWANGASILSTNVTRSTITTHNLSIAMAQGNFGPEFPFAGLGGEFGDLLIYERTLTSNELNQVGYYLTAKYDLNTAYVPEPGTCALLGSCAAVVLLGRLRKGN